MKRFQRGVGLIEAMVSLTLLSVGMLGMVGMQATLVKDGSDTRTRMQAGFFATSLLGMAAADPNDVGCFIVNSSATAPCSNADASAQATLWTNDVLGALPGSDALPPVVAYDAASGQMSVTLRWRAPGDDMVHNYAAVSQISTGL